MSTEDGTPFRIDRLRVEDLTDLRSVVETWIRKDGRPVGEEIEGTMAVLAAAAAGNEDLYLVARDADGRPLGVMGCGRPDERFLPFRSSPAARAAGLKTAFLSPRARGGGLGKRLLLALFAAAKEAGWTEMLWSSNPRYRDTAWGFYTLMAGKPVGVLEDFFAEGSRTPVWQKAL
jgi:L-amino acid N-acyltransferase YncA